MKWLLAVVCLACCLLGALPVRAQSEADKTTARELFFQAREAYEAGRYDEAADLFRRSNETYPAPTAALGQARALRDGGKLVAAYEAFNTIVRLGVPDDASQPFQDAVTSAEDEREALEPRLPALVIRVEGPESPTVSIDDEPVPVAVLGAKRFVDPGSRRVSVTAEGWTSDAREVTVAEGQTEEVSFVLTRIAVAPVPSPEPPDVTQPQPEPPLPPVPPPPAAGNGDGIRTAGLVIGGIGLASLIVAAITGGLYLGEKGTVDDSCVPNPSDPPGGRLCPTEEAVAAADSGRTLGLINTITLPIGVAAVGAGVLMFALAPSADELAVVPLVGPSGGGVVVERRF